MPELACPECRAEIKTDLVDDAGQVECPFCRHTWSLLDLPQANGELADRKPVTGVSRTISGITSPLPIPPLPPGSQVKAVEATEDRLVLYIPGGGKSATGLGCFAVAWNGFMCLFTPPWLIGMLGGGGDDGPPLLFMIPFLGLFWAVGLGIAWFWMKMKYQRTFLLLDRDRLVIQRVLFNRKRMEEIGLTPDSRAALVESYQQNDDPVYRIEVQGAFQAAKFGTALADAEKDWMVDRINDFLGRSGAWARETPATAPERAAAIANLPTNCRQCGAPLSGELVKGAIICTHCGGVFRKAVTRPEGSLPVAPPEQLVPADLPGEGPLVIDNDTSDALQFHYNPASGSAVRWLIPIVTLPFSLAWYGLVFSFVGGAWQAPFLPIRIVAILISIPFLLVGLFPFVIGLFMYSGRTTVRLTPETLECRWHAGPFHYSRSLGTESIDEIRVQAIAPSQQNPRIKRAQAQRGAEWKVCVVRAGARKLYPSIGLDQNATRQMTALLRTRLEDMGHVLPDA